MQSETRHHLFVDLSSFSPDYVGGVSRYAISITDKLFFLNSEFKVSIIPNQSNIKYLNKRYGADTVIDIYPNEVNKVFQLLERFNYNFFNSVRIFSILQKLRYKEVLKRVSGADGILYCPTTYLNFNAKKLFNAVSLHDIQEKKYPNNFTRDQRIYRDIRVKYTLKNSEKIQVSSHFMAVEIQEKYGKQSDLIVEISEGVDLNLFKLPINRMQEVKINSNAFQIYLPGKFLPHKNHIEFFKALDGLSNIPKINVVITEVPENIPKTVQEIVAKNPEMELRLRGNLTDQELVEIYSGSDLVVITSLYESSSLPILEAVACGARVLASSIPPHLEMALNLPVAIYESENCSSLQKSLVEILDQVQSGAKGGATDNIEIYAWENIAKIYLETFRCLLDVPNL